MAKRGLLVGRFQPFHKGHLETTKWCLERSDELIIAIGSSDKSYEYRNPFTAGERIEMIRETIRIEIAEVALQRIVFIPVPDVGTHILWTNHLDLLIPQYSTVFTNDPFTIMLFRERGIEIDYPNLIERDVLSATEVRYRIANDKNWREMVSYETAKIIERINGIARIKTIHSIHNQKTNTTNH